MAFQIEEWEIWHTYTSFLEATAVDLQKCAHRLVSSGIAECAMVSDGKTYWRAGNVVGSGSTMTDVGLPGGESKFRLELAKGCHEQPQGFALEAWGQASLFLLSEHRLFGEESSLPRPYLRAHLGKYVLSKAQENETSQVHLYPVLIVYESGVVIIEFRMIGPSAVISLPDFITGGVNLFQYKFDHVEVTPGLSKYATRAYHLSLKHWGFFQRIRIAWLQVGHDLAVQQRTRKEVDESFSHDLAPLSDSACSDLKSIAQTIFHTAAFVVGDPKRGLSFLLKGQPAAPMVGRFWSGRPHIYLVRFGNQCKTASENEAKHGPSFGRILSRAAALDDEAARGALPKDARLFEDYGAYLNSAASLWVWSKGGLAAQKGERDVNRGNLIYERQAIAELLEYGYMLYRSLYHRIETFGTTAEVIAVRREILQMRLMMREASHSGEIRELLENGWRELGLPEIINDIDGALDLRAQETSLIENLRTTRVGWALTLVFGFVAVPALADQVIKPIWKLTTFPQLGDSLTTVVSDGIAVAVVLIVVCFALRFLSPRAIP